MRKFTIMTLATLLLVFPVVASSTERGAEPLDRESPVEAAQTCPDDATHPAGTDAENHETHTDLSEPPQSPQPGFEPVVCANSCHFCVVDCFIEFTECLEGCNQR